MLCIHHNLVDNFSKMGRHAEAADLLPSLRDLAATHGSTLDRLRLQWAKAASPPAAAVLSPSSLRPKPRSMAHVP